MSYRTVVEITDRLTTLLQNTTSPEDLLEVAYSDLEELVEEIQDASYHRTEDPQVRTRFSRLLQQLSRIAADLQSGGRIRHIWAPLFDAIAISERIAHPPTLVEVSAETVVVATAAAAAAEARAAAPTAMAEGGESLEGFLSAEAAVDLLHSSPEGLLALAERELRVDPDSVLGGYMRSAALVALDRFADALATAERLAIRYPARHVATLAALACALQGRGREAMRRALEGMHLRLEAQRPDAWHRIPGLRVLTEDEAESIRQVNVLLVQQALHWLESAGWPDSQRFIFAGLLAPSLGQSRNLLDSALDDEEDDEWLEAARCGLARCARWRCDFLEAMELLEGLNTPFARQERAFISRDRALLEAGEIELVGFGSRLRLARTETATGLAQDDEPYEITEQEERSEAQIADLLKDLATSWIGSGFSYRILRRGTLNLEDLLNEEGADGMSARAGDEALADEDDPEANALVDVDTFFALYDAEELDGVQRYVDGVLEEKPYAPAAWGVKALIYLIRGRWEDAAQISSRAAALSGCRALAAPRALLPLANEDLGGALAVAMDNLSLRLRSATPPLPLVLPGFPSITPREGELLDQIEHNTWRMVEEVLEDMELEDERQQVQVQLIGALLAPNPVATVERIEALAERLEGAPGLRAAADVTLARWRRHEGQLDDAEALLQRALAAVPGFSYARQELARVHRDRTLLSLEIITLRGYGVTIELQREGRLLHQTFTPDNGSSVQSLTRWIDESQPEAIRQVLRDAALAWLESGFTLLLTDAEDA